MQKERFGEMVRAIRQAKGLTQVQLAKRAKIPQGYIAEIENGTKTNPSLDVLRRLAKALKVTVGELVD